MALEEWRRQNSRTVCVDCPQSIDDKLLDAGGGAVFPRPLATVEPIDERRQPGRQRRLETAGVEVGEGSEQAGDARLPTVEGSTVAGLAGLLLHILRAQHGRSLPFLVSDRLFSALDRAHVVR